MKLKSLVTATLLAGGMVTSLSTSAALLTFDLIDGGEFINAVNTNGDPIPATNSTNATQTISRISWGGSNGDSSSLELTTENHVELNSAGTSALLSTIKHVNNPIPAPTLDSGQIYGVLEMDSMGTLSTAHYKLPGSPTLADVANAVFTEAGTSLPGGADIDNTIASLFNFTFMETLNFPGGDCDFGLNGDLTPPCDDKFMSTLFGGIPIPIQIKLLINSEAYMLTIFNTINDPTGDINNAILSVNGMAEFITDEENMTSLYTFAQLMYVPEPATLGILGLGLLGMASRRKMLS
ncbi:PEP-CTERM sorting domain-containing protein [Endozoicomonas sp. SM1973]|uniref:PEP-CTERM sorting domain-containing protein n=1 Tax=Spartinivicinus marinus TaxID=2994442 RepID=A0A853HYC0_9GAMM|nr:PEP-CTERM sorting domain-containing protein [Spartinivicinus marinus]MCX4028131.1 PEP-CTERM sorting domain-containing protein [Spartinivicinus marinus]NYZ66193.1 PEP-CTERM sorting domain-containing protein [Spartinivicinus marinus]